MTVLGVVGMYIFQSFVSFFPAFLQECHGLTTGGASAATGAAFVLIAAVLPLVGRAGDAFGHDYFLVGPFLVTAAGFGLVRTTFVLVGSVGNAATGFLAEIGGWPLAVGVLIALLCVAAALVVGNRLLGVGL